MDFLVDNYIWFIIGFIVILMIIIGYLAEKTQFGSKKIVKKEKPLKKKKEEEVLEQVEQAKNTRINEAVLENAEILKKEAPVVRESVVSAVSSTKAPEKEESIPEELTVPFGNVELSKEEREPAPTFKNTTEVSKVEEPVLQESFEDMYQPLEVQEEKVFEEPSSNEDVQQVEQVDIPLPDIQPEIKNLNEEKNDDEDVWNF